MTVRKSIFSCFALSAVVLIVVVLHAVFPKATAAPPETPALPQAGTTITYNFDMETPGSMPAKFHAAAPDKAAKENGW